MFVALLCLSIGIAFVGYICNALYKHLFPHPTAPNTWVKGPEHLQHCTQDLGIEAPRMIKTLPTDYQWIKQLVASDGSEYFRISVKGNYTQLPIEQCNNGEVVVKAYDRNAQEYLVYDGFKHGWDSLISGDYEWVTPHLQFEHTLRDAKQHEQFKIYLSCTYMPAAFDELEEGIDEYGNVIIGGKYRQRSFKYDKVFADGFSSITIWVETPKGKVITLLSKQCATCMLTQ